VKSVAVPASATLTSSDLDEAREIRRRRGVGRDVDEVRLFGRRGVAAIASARASKPLARYAANCGIAIAAKIPMIATTTRSSIRVKPD
jgi:hypothetical protein